jgi:hypothetical protein
MHDSVESQLPDVAGLSAQGMLRHILAGRRQSYETEPARILEDFHNEVRTTESYNGRQLLELLQNADDAAKDQPEGLRKVLLRLTDSELLVANTGAPFSAKGVRSLLFANLSAKYGQPGLIGAKGLGFRALLNWSQRIRIDSGELHLAFSPDAAHSLLSELRNRSAEVRQTLADDPATHPMAILRWPAECAAPAQPRLAGYDTLITLDLTSAPVVIDKIQAQLRLLAPEVLVFLQHLDEVIIESPAGTHTLRCTGRGTNTICVWEAEKVREWQVFEHITSFQGETYHLKAAWNPAWAREPHASWLHTFFPTKVALPFPLLVHGPFELTSNRENLVNDEPGLNSHLLSELASFLVQVALALRASAGPDVFLPLRLLWDNGRTLQHGLEDLDFTAELRKHLRDAALLPRLDGSYGNLAETLYSDLPFARYLPACDCPNLLVTPATTADTAALSGILRQLGSPPPFTLSALLQRIAAARTVLPAAEYAQLLVLLIRKMKADRVVPGEGSLPDLFTGSDGEKLLPSLTQPVFLPPDEDAAPDSRRVPVRMMETAQAEALRKAFEVESFARLATELSILHLRAYSFPELARALVAYCSSHRPQRLHSELFRFFQAERRRLGAKKVVERAPGLSVVLPTLGRKGKTGESRAGHELYFGQAYDKPLCEELYHYNLSGKIVAGPAELGLAGKPLDQLVAYLRWCGVADEPRTLVRMLEPTERPYREFVLRRFDYRRERLNDLSLRNFTELAGYTTGNCQVTTIDDLGKILTNSKQLGTILAWVRGAATLGPQLTRAKEPATSYLEVKYGSLLNWRYVTGTQMASFLAWQFMTTPWLKAEGWEGRVTPEQTVLSPTIGAEFRPYLFRLPFKDGRLPAADRLFGSYAVYKQTMLQVGIRENIESVDVGLIYKVLSLLPGVDPTGRAARSIYRELAENFAWRPEYGEHESYRHFCLHGTVWCSSAAGEGYQPVRAVYYLPTADHSPTLRALFPLLAVAPGYESGKIQELFGVQPRPSLTLHLAEPAPTPHPLQARFDDDWHHLRPYLYAFRKDKSSQEDSLRRLQDLRIHLCVRLPVVYKDETRARALEIDEYRFVFPGKNNRRTAWLRVPGHISSLEQLQQEADACEAVAQLVCIALDTTVDKAHYDMLFGASRSKRDGILRNKLPSQGQAGLEEARQQLAYTSGAAQQFWTQFVHAAGTSKRVHLPVTTEAWRPWLLNRFPEASGQLEMVLADTDWETLSSAEGLVADELAPLWALFDSAVLEPAKFNKLGPIQLDFKPLFTRRFEQERDNYRLHFEAALRTLLRSRTAAQQKLYLTTLERYLRFMPPVVVTTKGQLANVWTKTVSDEFKLPVDWFSHPLDLPNPFDGNLKQLLAYGVEQNIPVHFIQMFLQGDSLQRRSLLYFDQLSLVKNALRKAYQPPVNAPSGTDTAASDRIVQVGDVTIRYGSWASLREQLEGWPRPTGSLETLKPQKPAPSGGNSSSASAQPRGRLGSDGAAHAEKSGQTGFLGELFAYWRLCDLYGAVNVVWESGNAQAAGLATEINDAAGYDLRYRPAVEQEWRRVEVKSGWEDLPLTDFYLSSGELAAGRKWGKAYELLLVSGVSQGPAGAQFTRIEAPFAFKGNVSFLDNPYFQVTTRNYHLRFRV